MVSNGFPSVTTSGQQYNIGEKPSVILYTCVVVMTTYRTAFDTQSVSSYMCPQYSSRVPFFVGVGKEQRRTKIGPPSRFLNRQQPLRYSNYLEDCTAGVLAVNVIGTQLRDQ